MDDMEGSGSGVPAQSKKGSGSGVPAQSKIQESTTFPKAVQCDKTIIEDLLDMSKFIKVTLDNLEEEKLEEKHRNNSLCYSSDRQLSLDLVNVGRQRLDFLPMLEHSGTYRETSMHTGTFAQEIITLVHQVKEQYFRDDGVTLTERFSTPQKGGSSEEETEELTLDERFSSNRGFSLNMNSLDEDEDESLFSRLQPVRGPGDLRHDLERRRQERLEGVKVTISGNSMSQRPLGPDSEPGSEYMDNEDMSQEDEGFSSWPDEQNRRREGNMGPRRGAPYRPHSAQRRNNRLGPMRRPNHRQNPAGPDW